MDITSFLTKEETIGGLEISDSYVRLCFFTQNKKELGPKLSPQKEQALPPGAVINGVIQDRQAVAKALVSLVNALPKKISYVIVAIPTQCTYGKLFSFPKSIQGKKLEETMGLTISFQLPLRTEDVYLDWETTEDRSVNEVILAASKKTIIDGYISVLASAKLSPVAIEPHIFAVLRAIDIPAEDHTLIIDETSANDILFWVAHEGVVRFMRSIPKRLAAKKEEEIKKISAFYEAEYGTAPTVLYGEHAEIRNDIATSSNAQPGAPWLASIGAAQRGIIPRAQDSLISLMPMGTVEAYKRHKTIAFVGFLANTTVGISLFFSAAFIGTWILMLSLQQRTLIQIENLSALPSTPDAAELEARAQTLNELTGAAHQTLQKIPRWSTVIDEIRKRSGQGIIVTNATFPAPEDMLTLTGTAANREQLITFKKSMEESIFFTEVSLPATNLEVREAIPFSLAFKLKDPVSIYEK